MSYRYLIVVVILISDDDGGGGGGGGEHMNISPNIDEDRKEVPSLTER